MTVRGCPGCGHENAAKRKFCAECGAPLASSCPACGAENEPGARFCGECGGALSVAGPTAAPSPAATAPSNPASAGKRDVSAAVPTSFAGGRYRVRRFLGEGAKKRVYLASDTKLASEVAFALLKAEGLDDDGQARLRREVQAMGRLRDHPHIVPIFDVGEEAGQPYIVSQFMSGGDVNARLRSAADQRLPVDEALRITDQICQALEHAHGNGVVHRDLKPGNVWLTEDGTAKLGDFGLAVSLDRSRLTQEGTIVGTVVYMPPEQALGKPPDARSDLYALGAMFYEMLTGRPPFVGDDSVAIISQHINTPPVAPSWHNPEVTPPLEALVLRLLAKAPQDRPESATAVRKALAGIEAGETEAPELASANPLDRLQQGVFVGREEEIRQLRHGVDGALSRPGRVLMLVGEPGIGKTRTSEELATYAQMRGAQVLWGRCYEGEGAPAFWPWRQIIRAYVHERDPHELASEMGPGAADIAEVVSEVRERLPGLPPPAPLDAEQARFRLFDSIVTFLRNAAEREPLVLVLDDLHWADKPSLLLLQFLAGELAQMRMLVLGTYRDVELSRQHPLAETLAELARSQLTDRVLLRGLQEADVTRFVELSVGRTPPATLVTAIYRETEGNPFFVCEVVRLLQSEGRLDQEGGVGSWSVEIPQGVREVIGRRLNGLSESCNQVLTLASVIGREFELALVEGVGDLKGDALMEALEEAVDARVIDEQPGAVGRYRFSHALIRETLYDELSSTRRLRLHRKTGEVLEELHRANPEPHLAQLAYHFCEGAPGGDVDKAVQYAIRAAERAGAAHAYEEQAASFDRALQTFELKPDPDPWARCVLSLGLARCQLYAGDADAADATYSRAVEQARNLGDAEKLARTLIEVQADGPVGTVNEQRVAALEEALAGLPEGDSELRAGLLGRLAMKLYFGESFERVQDLTRQALEMARRVGDEKTLVDTLFYRAFCLETNAVEARREICEERLALAEKQGDPQAVLMAHEAFLSPMLLVGDLAALDHHIGEVDRLTRELRQHQYEPYPILVRTMHAMMEGRFDEAEQLAEAALAKAGRFGQQNALQIYGAHLAGLRRLQGRSSELEPMLTSLTEQYPAIPAYRSAVARIHAEAGKREEAQREFDLLAADGFSGIPRDANWLVTIGLMAEVAAFLREQEGAAQLYDLLLPYERLNVTVAFSICSGSVQRYLGLCATVLEHWDDAERHFGAALERNRALGARTAVVSTLVNHAQMLCDRGRTEDRERARGLVNEALGEARELGMAKMLEACLALKLALQGVDSSDTTSSIYTVASAVQRERPDLASHAAADGSVTIMFSDMEGFTSMTERLGDTASLRIVSEHNDLVRQQLRVHGGHELELQGDGFMLAFPVSEDALRCAVAIQRAFADYNRSHADQPVHVRIGLHTGEAIADAEKFFGLTVILAARIAAQARGGEIVVSQGVREAWESGDNGEGELTFVEPRDVELKGISEPQRICSVGWR